MIHNSDLFNRVTEGRETKAFSLWVVEPDPQDDFNGVMATFNHVKDTAWNVEILFKYSQIPQVYSVDYAVPKRRASLTLVAATGLAALMQSMDVEMNVKGEMMFAMGDLIQGTVG